MQPLITVIVPVYNGEAFIEKCFSSILNQTYQNLEIIIINDGSKDKSPEICDKFAELDERIIVVHQKNVGLSSVRNKGLDMASGELIGFVDSDDSIHPRMFEILQKHLHENNADISMCQIAKVYNANINEHIIESNKTITKQQTHTFHKEEAFNNLFNENNLVTVVPWNKLYKREVFKHVRYPDGKVNDDEFVIHHIIQAAQKFVFTDAVLYYYFHNENSITNQKYNLKRLEALEAIKDRVLFFELKQYNELLQMGSNTYLHLIIIHYYLVQKYFPVEKDVMEKLKREFRAEFYTYKNILKEKNRMELKLFLIHPTVYQGFIKARKKLSYILGRNNNVLAYSQKNHKNEV
ncbi:glycosyltransferase family 2 protein [Virgibacillus sp. W0181]|uniref:glycosyltransferase family 2 protein n=1 Tax=Virgibacillus sp. W0181 TaxID=3391581 RepID=UPI003F475210